MKKFSSFFLFIVFISLLAACGKKPKKGEYAYCNLTTYIDTTIVFSSLKEVGQPVPIPVIAQDSLNNAKDKIGMKINEALLKMKVGDTTTVTIPIDENIKAMDPRIPRQAKNFLYGIRLVSIADEKQYKVDVEKERQKQAKIDSLRGIKGVAAEKEMKEMAKDSNTVKARLKSVADSMAMYQKKYVAGELSSQLKTTTSGLKYLIIKEGNGKMVEKGNIAALHYYGMLAKDGKTFDNSYGRGNFLFPVAGQKQVISGMDEGLLLLKGGTTAIFFIPANLGYGEQTSGPIPANSELMFWVELLKPLSYMEGERM